MEPYTWILDGSSSRGTSTRWAQYNGSEGYPAEFKRDAVELVRSSAEASGMSLYLKMTLPRGGRQLTMCT
jgi:hypothetical protein